MLPDFAIIGAQKSGSTALMRHLGDHPSLYLPDHETRYFRDPWFSFQSVEDLERDVETAKSGVLRRGIKCPDLLAEEACAGRMHDLLGEIPLVAVLREPVERAISAYFWGMQWGWVPLRPPHEGLMRILDGSYEKTYPRSSEVLEYGLYGKHLTRFHGTFDPDLICVVTDEDLRDDAETTLRLVLRHLGVDDSVELGNLGRHVNSGVYSMRRLRFLSRRHQYILREFPGHEGRYLQPAVGVRARVTNRTIAIADRMLLARIVPNSRPTIPAYVQQALADYYADDLRVLEDLVDRDFSAWRTRYASP